jgi:hypothetical protein
MLASREGPGDLGNPEVLVLEPEVPYCLFLSGLVVRPGL